MKDKIGITTYLTQTEKQAFKSLAAKRDISMARYIKRLILDEIQNNRPMESTSLIGVNGQPLR